jgi:hypothetical protein
MQVRDKTIAFARGLWVQFGGVDVAERGDALAVTGRDDESYLKVLNHFGRVLKLYTFEDGRWVDAETGMAALPFDESQAGRLPSAPPAAPPAARPAARAPDGGRAAAKPARKAAAAKPKAAPKPARRAVHKPAGRPKAAKAARKPTAQAASRAPRSGRKVGA